MEISLNTKPVKVQRIFCVGMNYAEHIKELESKRPERPVIFMKPASSIVRHGKNVRFPVHGSDLHFETELVLLVGREGQPTDEKKSLEFISGISVGFDLTLRDVQKNLKKEGLPWEISKAFDDSAPLADFVEFNSNLNIHDIEFSGFVNGERRQNGLASQMIFPVEKLVHYIGSIWKFLPGDLIFTGTPPGVGSLKKTDTISLSSPILPCEFSWRFE